MTRIINFILLVTVQWFLCSCEGVLDGIYDTPPVDPTLKEGQLTVDATSWTDWYYIDFPQLYQLAKEGNEEALLKARTQHEPYPIPFTLTTDKGNNRDGQYLYWFDVFGQGLSNNELRLFTPCDPQPEPDNWSIAIHRNNVRTNGGEVFETHYTSMDELPETSEAFINEHFTPDEWSENQVWDSQEQMLLGLVPSQGINTNPRLSSWLTVNLPPIPPSFNRNPHVFILRLKDGTMAALQLENYLSPRGERCYLTINYKYPY